MKLLQDGSPKDWSARAASVARESTRYNLNADIGTINRPAVTLALMQAPYQPQFTFTSGGADAKAGPGVRVIAFREKTGGVPLATHSPLWGRVWVDASTGMILKTELLFGNPRSPNQIVTTFETDPLLAVAVPIDMTEHYPRGDIRGQAHVRAVPTIWRHEHGDVRPVSQHEATMPHLFLTVTAFMVLAEISGRLDARQDAQAPQATFRTGIDVTTLDVSVLDKDRRPVRGLTAANFTVLERGKTAGRSRLHPGRHPATTDANRIVDARYRARRG